MAKAKAVQPDNDIGHNEAPRDDAILALNIAKLMAADILLDGAKEDHKAIKKHVEAKGVHLKAYAWADKIINAGDVGAAVELIEATLKILKIRGRPVSSSQIELFTTEADLTPSTERAAEQGRYAGIMGSSMDSNPYGPVGEQGQAWIEAFYGGEKERELILALEPGPDSELIKGDNDEPGDDPFEDADPAKIAAE